MEQQQAQQALQVAQQARDASAIAAAQTELADVQKQLAAAQAERTEAATQVAAAQAERTEAATQVAAAQAQVAAAQAERNAAAVQATAAQAERNAAAEAQLAAKNSELAAQRRNAEALAAEHTQSRTNLAAARASLNALEAQGAAASMADVAEREAAEARVQAAEARADALAAEQNQSRVALLQAQSNATAAHLVVQQQMNAARANVQRLEAELLASQQEIAAISGNRNAAQQEIATISGARNAALANAARIREQLATEQASAAALEIEQAAAALQQEEEDRAAAEAVAAQRKQEAEKAAQEASAAQEAQRVANEEVQQLRSQLEAAGKNISNKSATHASEIARMSEELREAQAHAAQQGVEAAAAAAAQEAAALLEKEAAVAAAQAVATEEAAAATLAAQQEAADAQAAAVAAARKEVEETTAARATEQAAAQAAAAQQEAQRIQEEADARVAALTSQLEASQKETQQATGNRNQDRLVRNAARADVERIKEELEAARTQSAEAQQAAAATLTEKEQTVQAALASQVAAEEARVAAEEARVAAEGAKEQAEEAKEQADASMAAAHKERNNAQTAQREAEALAQKAQANAEEAKAAQAVAVETQAAAVANAAAAHTARNAAHAERNAAKQQAAEARQEAEAAQKEKEEARADLTQAQQREKALQASLQEATARSEAASLAAEESTSATQAQRAQWNQQAATAAAEQASIQAALDAATADRAQQEREHQEATRVAQEALQAAQKMGEVAHVVSKSVTAQRNDAIKDATSQRERIAQLEREIQAHNAAAAAKLAELQQERNITLRERNVKEARAAADLIAAHEQELKKKNNAIAAIEAHRNERIAAAEANRNAALSERNAAQAEQERLLAQHKKKLAEANKDRRALSEQHAKALAEGNIAHANELQQRLDGAKQEHQQALEEAIEQAAIVVKEHSATVEAEKKERYASFASEKADWEAEMAEMNQNRAALVTAQRAALDQAATAEREKNEAIAAAQETAATAIAAAQAAEKAAQNVSASNRANRASALTAQREAEATAAEAKEKQEAAEAAAATATTQAAEQQTIAAAAQEAAQRATAASDAAQATQATLVIQQEEMTRVTQALQDQLTAATKAQEEAQQAVAAKAAQNAQNNAARQTASAAERAEWDRQMQERDAAISEASKRAEEETEKAKALQASLAAKESEYEEAQRKAEETLAATKAAADIAMQELEARHKQQLQENMNTITALQSGVDSLAATIASSRKGIESLQAEYKQALSEKNTAHAGALQRKALELEAQMVKLGEEKEEAMASLEKEKETSVHALQQSIATHEATIADLTARKEAAERGQAEATQTVKEKEREMEGLKMQFDAASAQLQQNTNRNVVMAMESNKILIQSATEEAAREKQRAEDAILLNKAQSASAIQQIAKLTTQTVDLKRQLQAMGEMVSKRLGVVDLSAVSVPKVSFQPVSREAVQTLITGLTRDYFLPWRTILRHPIAIRAHDLRENDTLRGCLQRFPLVTLFSPLPEEDMMRTLLGSVYDEYTQHQEESAVEASGAAEASAASSASSSAANGASSGGGEKAMRIDILLYYLIIGLRQAPIINQSDDFVAINLTVEQIHAFTEKHLEQNNIHIDNLQRSCGVKLADEHNKDPSLLTFLYLSSKDPKVDNARFKYEIEGRYQKSLTMTYSPTPTPFYDATGRDIPNVKGGDRRTYHYGPFTKIYPPTANSQTISHDQVFVDAVENRLRKGEAVTVIGYGASGSGKTTTLVYAKHSREPGLLAHVANRLIQSSQAGNGFISCNVIIYELDEGTPEGQCRTFSPASQKTITRTVLDTEGKATTYEIPVSDCSNATPFSYTIQEGRWANASRIPLEKEIVEYIDTKRNTAPTPNNPQSSRSHVICVLTFSRSEAKAAGDAVFIVCDFAGVENTFMCEDPRVRETIGVKALIDPMVQGVLEKAMTEVRIVAPQINNLVLVESGSSYLFDSNVNIISVFKSIERDCTDIYKIIRDLYLNAKLNKKVLPPTIAGLTQYDSIDLSTYGHSALSTEMYRFKPFIPSYQRILNFYRDSPGVIRGDVKSSGYDINIYQLLRILVWYTHASTKFQTLFQSLVTREYDPKATTIMTKTQIEAYSKKALCDQRVKEGVFINRSLAQLRSFIATSVSATSRTPPFLDECVPLQCHPHHLHCFGESARKEDGGPLTRLITKSVVGKTNTFCIFTVVNLSRDANNPPPTPYVDIGPLLTAREEMYPLIPGKIGPPKDMGVLNTVKQQMVLVGLQGTPLFQEFEDLQSLIQRGGDDVPHDLETLLQKLINHNAITTIGTMEFTDAMAKYGATQITCAPSFVKGQVKQIEQRAPVSTTARRRGVINNKTQFSSISLNNNTNGGRMPTRVRRKVNRRTRKKRSA